LIKSENDRCQSKALREICNVNHDLKIELKHKIYYNSFILIPKGNCIFVYLYSHYTTNMFVQPYNRCIGQQKHLFCNDVNTSLGFQGLLYKSHGNVVICNHGENKYNSSFMSKYKYNTQKLI
jgi:hypothetical protein